MSEHDDKQFEAYLAGDSPLSEHYRRAGEDGPPAALDARVLEHARRAIAGDIGQVGARQRWPWIAPLSAAAVIVLAAALVLEMTLPGAPSKSRRIAEPTASTEAMPKPSGNRAESVAADRAQAADALVSARPGGARATDSAGDLAPRKRVADAAVVSLPAPATADSAAQRESLARPGRLELESEITADAAPAQEAMSSPAPPELFADPPPASAAADMARPAGRLLDERDADTARNLLQGKSVAEYVAAPAGEPEGSDDQLQALTLMQIRRLASEGRDEEAAQLLDDLLERWPDIELPADFPLPDPRDEP